MVKIEITIHYNDDVTKSSEVWSTSDPSLGKNLIADNLIKSELYSVILSVTVTAIIYDWLYEYQSMRRWSVTSNVMWSES